MTRTLFFVSSLLVALFTAPSTAEAKGLHNYMLLEGTISSVSGDATSDHVEFLFTGRAQFSYTTAPAGHPAQLAANLHAVVEKLPVRAKHWGSDVESSPTTKPGSFAHTVEFLKQSESAQAQVRLGVAEPLVQFRDLWISEVSTSVWLWVQGLEEAR